MGKISNKKYKIRNKKYKNLKKEKINLFKLTKKPIIKVFISFILYSISIIKPNNKKNIFLNLNPSSIKDHFNLLLPKFKKHQYDKKDNSTLFKLEDSYDYKKMKETGKDKYIYDVCSVTKAKHENLYVREFVEYYLSIGVDKFYFGDDNEENIENLSDVLDDYVKKGIVDIKNIYFRNMSHMEFFDQSYESLKFRCKWMLFIDVDEFLDFNDKNMNIKTYLNMSVFDKCDVIRIHWLVYDDNGLVYYDERPIRQRLNHSNFYYHMKKYHKSIVRGKDFKELIFTESVHQPISEIVPKQCDALGNLEKLRKAILTPPKYKYCHFRHYTFKTAEEFAMKMLRGRHKGTKFKIEEMVDEFFKLNAFTKEKLEVIERILNMTFSKFHQNKYI